jgi:methyltransferase family protein
VTTTTGPEGGGPGPRAALLAMIEGYWLSQIARAAADLRLADHLADGAGTAAEIARRENADPGATARLMRACAVAGLLHADGPDRFAVTPPGDWGAPALLDLSMLVVAGGRERDLDQYDALAARAGWRRRRVLGRLGLRVLLEYARAEDNGGGPRPAGPGPTAAPPS